MHFDPLFDHKKTNKKVRNHKFTTTMMSQMKYKL